MLSICKRLSCSSSEPLFHSPQLLSESLIRTVISPCNSRSYTETVSSKCARFPVLLVRFESLVSAFGMLGEFWPFVFPLPFFSNRTSTTSTTSILSITLEYVANFQSPHLTLAFWSSCMPCECLESSVTIASSAYASAIELDSLFNIGVSSFEQVFFAVLVLALIW